MLDQNRAAYRILDKNGFFDGVELHEQGKALYFDGTPNELMEPLTAPARKALDAYVDELDRLGEEAAKKNGKQYARPPRSKRLGTFDAMRPELKPGDGGVPILGKKVTHRTVEAINLAPNAPDLPTASRPRVDPNNGARLGT